MECFNHTGIQAIGICKSCGKGICSTCAIIFTKGIACSEECEKEAKDFIEIMERSKKIYGIGSYKSNKLAPGIWMWLLFSATLWIFAGFKYFTRDTTDYFSIIMAILFSIFALISYRYSKRMGLNG